MQFLGKSTQSNGVIIIKENPMELDYNQKAIVEAVEKLLDKKVEELKKEIRKEK